MARTAGEAVPGTAAPAAACAPSGIPSIAPATNTAAQPTLPTATLRRLLVTAPTPNSITPAPAGFRPRASYDAHPRLGVAVFRGIALAEGARHEHLGSTDGCVPYRLPSGHYDLTALPPA
ncbi:hypothetical protein GCM10010339_77640 [Streptomyces alanosinicus]|uniref:Uncharacterized protein n=1 Tax=Streptomyces alanosinicus TaxID=68171 RepID=A0A918YRU9_9ACTN|nr:hypothetical protein GCM10010339_77640 [Streptomyces alanosinicus]